MTNILIVEDESTLNDAYNIILTKEGFKVTSVTNGQEALESIKEKTPDLILLDLRMPQMDGITFLEELEPLKNYPAVKIIVFSNYDVQKEIDTAYELGASKYMLKSWASPKELVRVVRETLANREQ